MADETSLLTSKLALCRGFYLGASTPGEVQVRSGLMAGQAFALPDPSRRGLLAELLGQLDGQRPVEGLLEGWSGPERSAVLKVLSQLVDRGILVRAEAGGPSWILQGLASLQGRISPEKLAAADVTVVGAGVLGSRVASNLVLMGVRRLSLWDPAPLTGYDRALSPAHLDGEEGAPRARSLARHLSCLEPSLTVRQLEQPEPGPGSLVIAAVDRVEPSLLHPLNQAALRTGTPWLLAAMDGTTGIVGPLMVPGQTGCYQCLESSWIARSRKPEQLRLAVEALQARPSAGADFYGLPAFADVVAGLLAADLPNILTQGLALTLGQVLSVDFLSLSAFTYPILKLPRCPACQLQASDAGAA
jgi:bacteriocin biosynthesis cyclodehydratase domain-containing protein